MAVKDFFIFSISVTLLSLCCAGCFYIWKYECAAQNEQQQLLERRKKSDAFYISEFVKFFNICESVKDDYFTLKFWLEQIADLENKMFQDGYTHAEALSWFRYM